MRVSLGSAIAIVRTQRTLMRSPRPRWLLGLEIISISSCGRCHLLTKVVSFYSQLVLGCINRSQAGLAQL